MTLIQRFGGALNLNIHFHLLVLDGVYDVTAAGPRFRRVAPPTSIELEGLLERIVTRIARHLERRGLVARDAENSYLSAGPAEEDGLAAVVGHSITYRIAVGPNEGRKAFTLQTLAPALTAAAGDERLAQHPGFSLHAGVAAAAHQLCRYIARPAVATGRLSQTAQGLVRYSLKTPYRDGTTERRPAERHRAMSWAQRLKRVFRIDIERCERCGGKVRIIASIEDPQVIGKILAQLQEREGASGVPADLAAAHRARAPPGQGELDLG